MLVPPLRAYLVQQQDYRNLQRTVAEQQTRVSDLQRRNQQWKDPAHIEQQARERLRYVRPGETAYVVVGAEALRDQAPTGTLDVIDPGQGDGSRAWYGTVWESIDTADGLGGDPAGTPVTRLGDGKGATSGPSSSSVTPVDPSQRP